MTRADVWLAQDSPDPEILVVGVPWAADSRCDLMPMALRDRLARFTTSKEEWGVDLAEVRVRDEGNWAVSRLGLPDLAPMISKLNLGLPDDSLRLYVGGENTITALLEEGRVEESVRFSRSRDPLTSVEEQLSEVASAIHVSVDLAVLDRVFAPGAPEARPGGLLLRPLAEAVRRFASHQTVVAFDFVGVDPELDRDGLTLDAAAYLMLSAVAGFRERS